MVKSRKKVARKVKPHPEDEGWKRLKSFVGLKFSNAEKVRLWKHVKELYVYQADIEGPERERHTRPNLGTFIKNTLFRALESAGRG